MKITRVSLAQMRKEHEKDEMRDQLPEPLEASSQCQVKPLPKCIRLPLQ